MPTTQIVLEDGISPLDVFILGKVVQAINKKRPELELKLESFDSRGLPHAMFTVLRREDCDEALQNEIKAAYEAQIAEPGKDSVRLKEAQKNRPV
jgi:CRISPR/Cas system-associated protein Csx1